MTHNKCRWLVTVALLLVAFAAAARNAAGAATLSPQAMDGLTASIALYPDALIAQILEASLDIPQLNNFSGWMGKNASLKGEALQNAAHQAGFSDCLVALAPFPQVVQTMVQKPDWTAQLGQAFSADRGSVFESIQRLRAQAKNVGSLKTTPQQEVVTETTSTGQTVIVVQPANPQVIYVPVYNPQTVYVAPPPAQPSAGAVAVAFTAGIIIGAAASNNYYHGPYAWHGGGMYNEAWDRREDYADHRQDQYHDNSSQRQSTAQSNQSSRQSTQSTNSSSRQSTQDTNQASRQSTQSTNSSSRQTTQSTNSSSRQSTASTAQGSAQANQGSRQSSASSASASTRSNGQASGGRSAGGGGGGYQSGKTTKTQSSRGQSSLSASRGNRSGGSRSSSGGRSRNR